VSAPSDLLHLAVALDGTGWHPASWREPDARPADLLTPRDGTDLVTEAERGLLDFVTIEDGLTLQFDNPLRADERTDRVRGRLDAVLIASRVAPRTSNIGLVPTAITTHTEPFHLSKAIATLDYVSSGRAGVRVQVSASVDAARHFGRRDIPERSPALTDELFDEAADYVEVLRRLWDSWEDDAEIRDVATRRFIDRDKVHTVDFEGEYFHVRGPSTTPRSPQGQPVVTALAHRREPYELAARGADLVWVTPTERHDAAAILREVEQAAVDVGRTGEPLHVYGDVVVVLDTPAASGRDRLARLEEAVGEPYRSDTTVLAGSAAEVADLIGSWHALGYRGARLRPAVVTDDLPRIVTDLVPELQHRGLFRTEDPGGSLRARLGLPVTVPNRYAA
jgi:alkanesulfonate monooxygenase SsuD/methylene tetrahydromethanopterin reductase-like flavin-dependent oxidoreductase (luciferase family)